MSTVQEKFIEYILKYVGQPYVWGGTGETLTPSTYEAYIDRKETSTSYKATAKSFCRKLFIAGHKSVTAHDCSGYISKALMAAGLRTKRTDCDGLWSKCTRTYSPADFTLLFRWSSTNKEDETHVGVYYKGYQYHAKGRSYGVVKEKYRASYWHKMGTYPGLSAAGNAAFAFTKVLKNPMYSRQDVRELKKLLIAKGYTNGITATNGNFLSSTEKVVRQFQADNGLQVDGKAGRNTITALGGTWKG